MTGTATCNNIAMAKIDHSVPSIYPPASNEDYTPFDSRPQSKKFRVLSPDPSDLGISPMSMSEGSITSPLLQHTPAVSEDSDYVFPVDTMELMTRGTCLLTYEGKKLTPKVVYAVLSDDKETFLWFNPSESWTTTQVEIKDIEQLVLGMEKTPLPWAQSLTFRVTTGTKQAVFSALNEDEFLVFTKGIERLCEGMEMGSVMVASPPRYVMPFDGSAQAVIPGYDKIVKSYLKALEKFDQLQELSSCSVFPFVSPWIHSIRSGIKDITDLKHEDLFYYTWEFGLQVDSVSSMMASIY